MSIGRPEVYGEMSSNTDITPNVRQRKYVMRVDEQCKQMSAGCRRLVVREGILHRIQILFSGVNDAEMYAMQLKTVARSIQISPIASWDVV